MGEALRAGLRAYFLIAAMWIRSTMTYRASFAMLVAGNFAVTSLDFAGLAIIFGHIQAFGGFTLPQSAFLYGTSGLALGLADLLLGSTERLGRRVRDGTLDTLLVRPVPVFAQVAADRFGLHRLGRVAQAGAVLAWSLPRIGAHWTLLTAALVPVMLLSGTAIFGAVFTAGAAFQFRAGDAAEVQNSLTYGGQYPRECSFSA